MAKSWWQGWPPSSEVLTIWFTATGPGLSRLTQLLLERSHRLTPGASRSRCSRWKNGSNLGTLLKPSCGKEQKKLFMKCSYSQGEYFVVKVTSTPGVVEDDEDLYTAQPQILLPKMRHSPRGVDESGLGPKSSYSCRHSSFSGDPTKVTQVKIPPLKGLCHQFRMGSKWYSLIGPGKDIRC
jgi:hypothetical protein